MSAVKLFVCVAIVAASLKDVRAISKEQTLAMYEKILPHITECSKDFGIADGALKEAKMEKKLEGIDPCFFACVLKKSAMMSDDGKFDDSKALEKSKEHLTEEEDIKNAEKVINDCKSVNSEDADECGRAKSLVECFMKHKEGFKTDVDA